MVTRTRRREIDQSPIGKPADAGYLEEMPQSERSVNNHRGRRAAGVLLVFAWVFWLHRWAPALLVVTFVAWVILHNRLEAGLGPGLRRQWRRAWPPGPVVLIALLLASTLAFVLQDAPVTAKILPVGLIGLALSVALFGTWWRLVALPSWLGGAGPSPFPVRTSQATGAYTLALKGERT